jgi:hypothetical protein
VTDCFALVNPKYSWIEEEAEEEEIRESSLKKDRVQFHT